MQIKNIIIGIAIVILTSFVTIYGMSMFYPEVNYDDYCGFNKPTEIVQTKKLCDQLNGTWTPYNYQDKIEENRAEGYCDLYTQCSNDFEAANKIRSKNIFIFSIPLGILVIALGAFLFSLESVGAGLMGGGVFTLIYGAGNYWRYGEDWFRFTISLIGLIAAIGLAYWFNNKFNKKRK